MQSKIFVGFIEAVRSKRLTTELSSDYSWPIAACQ